MILIDAACPRCAFPRLMPRSGTYEYEFAARHVLIDGIEYAACHRCGFETFLPEQIERNNQRIADANLEALATKWAATVPVVLSEGAIAALLRSEDRPR